VIDIFGTQALARFPCLFMALVALLPGYNTLINKIIANPTNAATIIFENLGALIILMLVGIVILIMVIWMVALMYRAFAVSFNVSGWKAIVSFIIGLIIAEVLSKIAIILAIKSILS
jgi:sterol desaturase/sphingolipid hydroxylase (fatty acid hydroxylase superfamily)